MHGKKGQGITSLDLKWISQFPPCNAKSILTIDRRTAPVEFRSKQSGLVLGTRARRCGEISFYLSSRVFQGGFYTDVSFQDGNSVLDFGLLMLLPHVSQSPYSVVAMMPAADQIVQDDPVVV